VNALSVRQELQADSFAGLWGHAANRERPLLDPGDLEEALQAATGDDRLSGNPVAAWFRTALPTVLPPSG
jgi:predicted metalloprotease